MSTQPRIDLNRVDVKTVLARLEPAFQQTCVELGGEFTKQISSPKWSWPRGESPRDIVDSGRLRGSQKGTPTGFLEYTYYWPVDYAVDVLIGKVRIVGGRAVVHPGRNWIKAALKEFDFSKRLAAKLR